MVSVDFGKNMLDSCAVMYKVIEGQLLLYNFIVYLQQNDILSKPYPDHYLASIRLPKNLFLQFMTIMALNYSLA